MLFRGFVDNSNWKNEKLVTSYCQKYLHSLFFFKSLGLLIVWVRFRFVSGSFQVRFRFVSGSFQVRFRFVLISLSGFLEFLKGSTKILWVFKTLKVYSKHFCFTLREHICKLKRSIFLLLQSLIEYSFEMSEVILKFYKNKTKTIINAKHIYYLISESVFIILFLNPYLLFYF